LWLSVRVIESDLTISNGAILQVLDLLGGRTRTRTLDPLIKSSNSPLRRGFQTRAALRRNSRSSLFIDISRLDSQSFARGPANFPDRQNRLKTVLIYWTPMADIRMLLTDKTIAQLPAPSEGWYLARDTELKGFFVVIGKRKRTFTVQGDLRQ